MSANITNKAYSKRLQRAVCDFGADGSFAKVSQKLKEHHLIDIPESAARSITLNHAREFQSQPSVEGASEEDCIVAEMDGCMIPIVEVPEKSNESDDVRKSRKVCYQEARVALAYKKGSKTPVFEATLESVESAGYALQRCVKRIGLGLKTFIHCVADGAPWIAEQVENRFGTQAKFTIDFYHLSQYLAAAALCCDKENAETWRRVQQNHMKENEIETVLNNLNAHVENCSQETKCTAETAFNYMIKRTNQFDYKTAIASDLPIGSGEIESANKCLVQSRLKIPGAWWKVANAEAMLHLRTARANGDWEGHWMRQNTSPPHKQIGYS
jgi:hypothetical protein